MRKTKIVCTIGPVSKDSKTIARLMSAVDVFRINFSHGDNQSHLDEIRTIRKEAAKARKTVAILQDLPGPKIRIGRIAHGSVDLPRGAKITLTSSILEGNASRISSWPPCHEEMSFILPMASSA
jgi:pyruvate kinase